MDQNRLQSLSQLVLNEIKGLMAWISSDGLDTLAPSKATRIADLDLLELTIVEEPILPKPGADNEEVRYGILLKEPQTVSSIKLPQVVLVCVISVLLRWITSPVF